MPVSPPAPSAGGFTAGARTCLQSTVTHGTTASPDGIDYSGSTPDITFTYDRMGRQKTVADAVGSRTFAYNADLQLSTETITGLYEKTITRSYDASGRSDGLDVGAGYDVSYGYDGVSRFSSVTAGLPGWETNSFSYSYIADSGLLTGWSGEGLTVARSHVRSPGSRLHTSHFTVMRSMSEARRCGQPLTVDSMASSDCAIVGAWQAICELSSPERSTISLRARLRPDKLSPAA